MKRLLIMTAGLLGALAVQATTYTWTGGGAAGSWRDPANWGGSGYPNGTDDVAIFDKDAAVTLDTGAVTPIAKFEIGANAMVTIADDGSSSFQITTRKGATSLGPRLAAGAKLYLSATMDWKTTETTSNRIDPQVLAGAELHLRGKLTTDAGNVYFQGYGDVYFDGDCDIDGTSVFHFGIFATSTDKKLRVFVLDRANIAVRSILTGANSQSPATEFVQEGEETAITLANGNFGLGYDTALTAGYRNGGNSYTIKSGSLTITGSATGGSGCFYVGGKQEGAFIQEGGTVTIRKIEVGSTMAADKVAVALKGGILKFTEGTSEPYSNVLAFANDCRMEVTGGTFAWPAEFHPSYLPQIGWGGRFTITTTKDKTNAMWDFGLSTIRPGATFVYAKGCTMRFYNHFTTFGLGLEVGTNATLTVEGFSTITLPAGTTDPWKVKICDGATLKLANYATRLALPLDLEIEGTGKISTPDVRNGLVAHRLTVGGVEKPFGRYLAKDSGFFTGSLNESSVIVPRVWTGKGDGKSWTDAANWSDETESAYVDLSRATTVELPDAPTTLAFVSVLGDATDGMVTLTGDKLLTFNDTSYAVAAFAAEGRELVLDADVRVSAGCLGLAGGGAVRFKRRYPGGDGGTAPFALDCDVYYDGTGELYPKTDSATQNFLTFWTFNMGYSRFFIDEGARLSGWRLICGPKGYVEFDEIHQRGGTVNLGSFYLNNHNFTTRKLT